MCRWAAYLGPELFLETIVSAPCHSLVAQSHCALEAKTATNGDGFGIAWYGARPEPGLYRDILPAWSDPNLQSLCRQISSRLFLAHVRAATGGGTSRTNCHPFTSGRWSFMHNGQIGAWGKLRRRLESLLPDALYDQRQGTTDSEFLFLLMLAEGLDQDPFGAAARAVGRVTEVAESAGLSPDLKLTACFSDGETLWALRHASDGLAPTLYTAQTPSGGRCLVSEPFDRSQSGWQAVPPESFVAIRPDGMTMRPFVPASFRLARIA